LGFDQSPGHRLDSGFGAGCDRELAARIVEMKINGALA